MPTPFALTESAKMVRALAREYGRLPTEILRMEPGEFYLNLVMTFPEIVTKRKRHEWRDKEERKLGYNPIRRLIENLKSIANGRDTAGDVRARRAVPLQARK